MKHINPILSVPFKVTCRKTILAAALFCGFSMMANAQIQDGRDFSMDGFAAYEGVPGSNWYRAGGTTGGAGGTGVEVDTREVVAEDILHSLSTTIAFGNIKVIE